MDDTTDTTHVPHVLDDPHDDPAFTAWLDGHEALWLTQRSGHTLLDTTSPARRPL